MSVFMEKKENINNFWLKKASYQELCSFVMTKVICDKGSLHMISDLIIPGLVINGTAKICCRGLILVLFNSTMVIKNGFGLLLKL